MNPAPTSAEEKVNQLELLALDSARPSQADGEAGDRQREAGQGEKFGC